ncbi:hypothetical protein COCCADRAFT_93378 [Bipolaris zeicola 26-R-13]|uniref:Uncharacterized protein n=1 Tax=Cochliobolus carbonum (strain 26-R-13) TaxID=930089 RepID=W6YG39_COCC2|nr:uncharacterized protein COCCADRAFT_93378 [Bipolaris zeicola 26-R-13]EUC34439.1 hypothetical protein COCCADRAFT_93378 [Bipolaris zeicola 26-R-13]
MWGELINQGLEKNRCVGGCVYASIDVCGECQRQRPSISCWAKLTAKNEAGLSCKHPSATSIWRLALA